MASKIDKHLNQYGSWFTAVSHELETRNKIKETCKEFPFWAWIDHSPDQGDDDEEVHFHTHVLVRTIGTRTIKQVADKLDIPPNFVQVVLRPRSMKRYLLHLDNSEKKQYNLDDIHTSNISQFQTASQDNQDPDVRRLYSDLKKLRLGQISCDDFVDLHYLEIQKLNFYQKIRVFDVIQAHGIT